MVYIPLDILDLVFTELQPFSTVTFSGGAEEPKRELRSCTLVCREWQPLATSHLFRNVGYSFVYSLEVVEVHGLRAADDPRLPGARWTPPGVKSNPESCIPTKSLGQFREFLAGSLRICPSIRTLFLEGYPLSDHTDEEWRLSPEMLVSIINMLPNLRRLHLFNFAITPLDKPANTLLIMPPTPLVIGRTLRSVSMGYSSEEDGQENILHPYTQMDVFELLKCFSEVEDVRIDLSPEYWSEGDFDPGDEEDYGWEEEDSFSEEIDDHNGEAVPTGTNIMSTSLDPEPMMLLRLHSLTIGGENQSPKKFLEALLKHPEAFGPIRRLRLFNPWPSMVRSVSWFLQETADVLPLEHLEISSNMMLLLDGLNISVCASLQTLELSLRFTCDDYSSCCHTLDALVPFFLKSPLSRFNNPMFTSLTFRLRFTSFDYDEDESTQKDRPEDEIAELRGNMLDGVLVEFSQRMGLAKLLVTYLNDLGTTRSRAEITLKHMFPKLKEKGYLQLTYMDELY